MKNLLIALTLILGVSIFSSCSKEECETCTYVFAWVDVADDYVATADETAAMEGVMEGETDGELCDDALTDAKDAWTAAGGDQNVAATDAVVDDPDTDVDETAAAISAWSYTMTCVASE